MVFDLRRHLPLTTCFLFVMSVASWAASPHDRIQAHLDAGEFGVAKDLAGQLPEAGDNWLTKIARAQLQAGARQASKISLRQVSDTVHPLVPTSALTDGATGGGSMADFDSLIDLITTTVEPDSWDDVGGPGSIAPFEGGVRVDVAGVLQSPVAINSDRRLLRTRFLARHSAVTSIGNPMRESDLRMVSLSRLQRELQIRAAVGQAPSSSMRHLAGMRDIRYVFVYPDTNEVVIAGPAGAWNDEVNSGDSPSLLLDDLVTLMRNARNSGRFGCSIDPRAQNLARTKDFLARPTGSLKPHQTKRWVEQIRMHLGLQDIVTHGIEADSHVARVLVDADYHMKLVGMGIKPGVPSVPSYLASISASSIPDQMDVLRWWFTLKSDALSKTEDGTVFVFADHPVKLESENERLTTRGQRIPTGTSSELNQLFADKFTTHYAELADAYPVYARLENVFQLALLAGLLQSEAVQTAVDWSPAWLVQHYEGRPEPVAKTVKSIVNHRVIDRRHVVVGVSGGVSVDTRTVLASIANAKVRPSAAGIRKRPAAAHTAAAQWWWD